MNIYEEKEKELINTNRKHFLKNYLKDKKYKYKIEKYVEKFGYNLEEVYLEIKKENKYIIDCLIKQPNRQNYHEDIALEYIKKNYKNIQSIEKLDKKSRNSLYLSNGLIIDEIYINQTDNHSKSIDFIWKYKGFNFFATHKYTKESGGAQDNQFKDVKDFLNHAKQNKKRDNIFVAILDGKYYTNNKIFDLKKMVKNTNCFVTNIYDLEKDMINFVETLI